MISWLFAVTLFSIEGGFQIASDVMWSPLETSTFTPLSVTSTLCESDLNSCKKKHGLAQKKSQHYQSFLGTLQL